MKQIIKVQTPSRITIGDRLYFNDETLRQRLMFETKPMKKFITKITMEEVYQDDEKIGHEICIVSAPSESICDMYVNQEYPSHYTATEKILGCDTASFDIIVDGRDDTFYTLSDGMFGSAYEFRLKHFDFGFIIVLFICEAAYSEDVEDRFKYLFKEEKTNDRQNYKG